MPIIPDSPRTQFVGYGTIEPTPVPPAPSAKETWRSAFELENSVINAIRLMKRNPYQPDPQFKLSAALKERGLWEDRDYYLGAQSAAEMDSITEQVARERKNRETLAAAGWGGVAAAIAAGTLDPTMFIPLMTPAKGAKLIAQASLLGLTAAGIQEGVLYTQQETRTPGEVGFSLAASTVVGGILGSAVAYARKGDVENITKAMASQLRGEAATLPPVRPLTIESSLSADTVRTDPGKFATGSAAGNWIHDATEPLAKLGNKAVARLGPITRGILQPHSPIPGGSPEVRWHTAQFGDAGLRFESTARGIAAAPGGSIADLQKTSATYLVRAIEGIDEHYAKYIFDDDVPAFFPATRARVTGMVSSQKMSPEEFRAEVWRALVNHDDVNPHPIRQVMDLSKLIDRDVFKPLYDEAVELGVIVPPKEVLGDHRYATRLFNEEAVTSRFETLVTKLASHYERKLVTEFEERLRGMRRAEARDVELIEDIQRPEDEVKRLKSEFEEQLEGLEEGRPQPLVELEDEIDRLRKAAREAKTPEEKKKLLAQVRATKGLGGLPFQLLKEDRAKLRRRLRNLSKSKVALAERQEKKLQTIERVEGAQIKTLTRAVRSAKNLVTFLDKGSDREIKKALKVFRNDFEDAVQSWDKGEERILALANKENADFNQVMALEDTQGIKLERANAALAQLDELEAFDRVAWRASVQEVIDDVLSVHNAINSRRAVRVERLRQQAAKLDPALAEERLARIRAGIETRRTSFTADLGEPRFGAENIDLARGTADFKNISREIAEQTVQKIKGSRDRVPITDIMAERRGPEMARTLDIPSREIEFFLEKDIEKLVRYYVKTLGADIAIARKFGTANATSMFQKLRDEESRVLKQVADQKDKDGNPLPIEVVEKRQKDIQAFYDVSRGDLEALMDRVKGIRGLGTDPASYAARALHAARNLNVSRYMGGVAIASVPDIGRLVTNYGLLTVLRHAFIPMITNFKALRMSQREAKLAGNAFDLITHSRAHQVYDIADDLKRGTKFEKFLEYTTSKIGLLALFDVWNVVLKEATAGLEVRALLDDIDIVLNNKGSAKARQKAVEHIARANLEPDDVGVIWEQVTNRVGGGQVNGVWVPQTDAWDVSRPEVKKALRAFRAGMNNAIDRTIVTPGLERPLMMDASPIMKSLWQFKSFGMSSTTRTALAGLQQRDMAYLNGIWVSLALGTLSYYLWAVASGGDSYKQMLNASPEKWADEAWTRSGLGGALTEAQELAQFLPFVGQHFSASGQRSTRKQGADLMSALGGPTFDLVKKGSTVLVGLDDPTQNTLHTARQLVPYQNVFWLRYLLDRVEEQANLPERRRPR